MSEEYDGMFSDCHSGNEYMGGFVQPTHKRKCSTVSIPNESKLLRAHMARKCNPATCEGCKLERRDMLESVCPTCQGISAGYAFSTTHDYARCYRGHVWPVGKKG